jgi:L-seryl-tRNA(Ser) seleniumtransferase
LPHEPTVAEALDRGADLVTFSGDKLLGGPQAGLVVGRAELILRLARNPLKRALRLDKIRLAALEAVLRLYADPDRLAERLPALRLLARPMGQIRALGERLLPAAERAFRDIAEVALVEAKSQIGSGALPISLLPSTALAIRPLAARSGVAVEALARDLRALPIPIIGRIEAGRVVLDLRCLEDEAGFIAQLDALSTHHRRSRKSGRPEPAPGLNRGRLPQETAALDSRCRGNDDQRPDADPLRRDP